MKGSIKKDVRSSLKFVYSDNNSLSVIFQDNDLLIGVVGEFNKNLKELEKITQSNLYSRGNSILIKSNPEKNFSKEFKPSEIFQASDLMVESLTQLLDRERNKKKAS